MYGHKIICTGSRARLTRALLRLERTMNLIQGSGEEGRGGEGSGWEGR